MTRKHIKAVIEFHHQFQLGVNEAKQTGMFERNNLLLEEMGELIEAISLADEAQIKSEALDVYYILLGNCAYLGIDDLELEPLSCELQFNLGYKQFNQGLFILEGSKLAQLTRKRFDDEMYFELIKQRMSRIIVMLQTLFVDFEEMESLFSKHHQRMLNKQSRKIGDVIVVSNFKI